MPSISKKRQKSAKKNTNEHITTTTQSPPTFQLQIVPDDQKLFQQRGNSLDIKSLKAQKHHLSGQFLLSNHKEMDEYEKIHNSEDTQKVELESEEQIIVIEGDVADENSETVKETHDDNDDESTEPVVVDADEPKEGEKGVIHSTEPPAESLSEECSTKVPTEDVVVSESKEIEVNEAASPVVSNGVLAPLDMDVVSKGIEPSLDESETNGVPSDIVNNLVPKGVESSTDENNECEASDVVTDSIPKEGFEETELPDSDGSASVRELPVAVENAGNILQPADDIPGVLADNGGENCNASEGHDKNTNKQPYISVIPSPVQRTSWRGCCGLFEVLRRSNY